MDITTIVEAYQAVMVPWNEVNDTYSAARESGLVNLPLLLMFVGLIPALFGIFAVSDRRLGGRARLGSWISAILGLTLVVMGVLSYVFVVPPAADFEARDAAQEKLSVQVAEAASEYYGVDVPTRVTAEAIQEGDDAVILFGSTHDGEKKSLGFQLDLRDSTATVYQGNKELPAAE